MLSLSINKKLVVLILVLVLGIFFSGCIKEKSSNNEVDSGGDINLIKLNLLINSFQQKNKYTKRVTQTILEGIYIPSTVTSSAFDFYSFDKITSIVNSGQTQSLLATLKTNAVKTYIILDYNGYRALYWNDFNKLIDFNGAKSKDALTLSDLKTDTIVKDIQNGILKYADGSSLSNIILPSSLLASYAPWDLEIISQPRSKAYPGILYEYRMAVIGGIFPYKFSLEESPQGMTITEKGLIKWTPSVEGKYSVKVKITDLKNNAVSKLFTIDVSTKGFYFVSPNGKDADTENGTITAPWKTIGYTITKSLTTDSVIYIRGGNYTQSKLYLNDSVPVQFLAYPGEKPIINMDSGGWSFVGAKNIARFEGLEFYNMKQYGIWTENNMLGMVVRNCVFRDGFEDSTVMSENPAFIHAAGWASTTAGYHNNFVIQDNIFRNFTLTAKDSLGRNSQTSGALVYFDVWYSLCEDNIIENIQNQGITDKDNSYKNTYRKNYITGTQKAGIDILGQYGAHEIQIDHNLIVGAQVGVGGQGMAVSDIYIHHNTLVDGSFNLNWGMTSPDTKNVFYSYNIVSYELSTNKAPIFWGNLETTNTWYMSPMLGHFSSDYNIMYTNGPVLFGAEPNQGAIIDEYNLTQLQAKNLEKHGINTKVGLVGTGQSLGIPTSSQYFGIYGHQYNSTVPSDESLKEKEYKHGDLIEVSGDYGTNDVTKTFLGGTNGLIEKKEVGNKMENEEGWSFDDIGGDAKVASDSKRGKVIFNTENNNSYNAARIYDPGVSIPEQRYFYKAHYVRNVMLLDGVPYTKSFQWKHERINWEKSVSDGDCEIKIHNWQNGGSGLMTFVNRSSTDKSTYYGGNAADSNSDWCLMEVMVYTGTNGLNDGKMITRIHKNGKTYINQNKQGEKIYASPSMRLRYFVEQNYFGNFGQIEDGVDNTMPKPEVRELYSDDSRVIIGNNEKNGWKRVELRDSLDLKNATVREIQDWNGWNGNISVVLNTGGLKKGKYNMYLVVIDGVDENGWDIVAGNKEITVNVE